MIGWSLVFAGLGWGLALGALALPVVLTALAWRRPAQRSLGLMLGFGLAFALVTWFPLLWLVVGYLRYLIAGEPIEND